MTPLSHTHSHGLNIHMNRCTQQSEDFAASPHNVFLKVKSHFQVRFRLSAMWSQDVVTAMWSQDVVTG